MKGLRGISRANFLRRLERAREAGDLPDGTDVEALASAFNTLLQGLSIQARDGASRGELERVARASLAMLPGR
jgi:hypothetical protein